MINEDIKINRIWLNSALVYLFIVALLGVLMRYSSLNGIPYFNFKYILHAHSHTALLGWVYAALYIALLQNFLPAHTASSKKYNLLFWLTQLSVFGMLMSFPVQGYAAVSITFSTLHILFSYVFAGFFLADLNRNLNPENKVATSFAKAAILFLVISSIGPFSLGAIMAKGLSGSNIYYLSVYYYLHFQYNGWFTFAIFAINFSWLQRSGISFSHTRAKLFFRLMFWSFFPAYALSALWTAPASWVYIFGGAAAAVQVAVLIHFTLSSRHIWGSKKMLQSKFLRLIFLLSFIAFAIKILLQLASAVPEIAHVSYIIREFIIGYLHLVLIGFVSLFLIAYFIAQKAWQANTFPSRSGLIIFITAFAITEILIFLQGFLYWQYSLSIPNYNMLLLTLSLFLPIGIGMFLFGQFRKKLHI